MIVPAAIVDQCRALAAVAVPGGGEGMFATGLSADGRGEPTHYVSAGMVDEDFAALLDSPEAMHAGLSAAGADVTLQQCEAILGACDVSDEPPFVAMERLGLQLLQPAEEAGDDATA